MSMVNVLYLFMKLNVGEGPSWGLMPASSLQCLVSSSPFPLSANIACTAASTATAAILALE